jgi:hypothetical protein
MFNFRSLRRTPINNFIIKSPPWETLHSYPQNNNIKREFITYLEEIHKSVFANKKRHENHMPWSIKFVDAVNCKTKFLFMCCHYFVVRLHSIKKISFLTYCNYGKRGNYNSEIRNPFTLKKKSSIGKYMIHKCKYLEKSRCVLLVARMKVLILKQFNGGFDLKQIEF